MVEILFDAGVERTLEVESQVSEFFEQIDTREGRTSSLAVVCRDGKSESYYINCSIPGRAVCDLLDLDARLDPNSDGSFRANRELVLRHNTYRRMKRDAQDGREFNDIVVEYCREYLPERPLKVWGGQHRSKAIQEAYQTAGLSRYHGFRVYFCLNKRQRTDLALISNTNIAVSNNVFDRLQEETLMGTELRGWCWQIGLLEPEEDFPDKAAASEKISVRLARTFIVNYFLGKERGQELQEEDLDKNVYEPYVCESGASIDEGYERVIAQYAPALWSDEGLLHAGTAFAELHRTQRAAVESSDKVKNLKAFRNKALVPSVLAGWSYVAGLLQPYPQRLEIHFRIPRPPRDAPDPLNAEGMSTFQHYWDPPTYRGLGTRSTLQDRQRMAQVFLAKSKYPDSPLGQTLLHKAVSQVQAIRSLEKGYSRF